MPPPVPSQEQEAEATRLLDSELPILEEVKTFLRAQVALPPRDRAIASDSEVLLVYRVLATTFGDAASLGDLGALLDAEITQIVTATPQVTIMDAGAGDPPAWLALRCALAIWFPPRLRRLRDACARSQAAARPAAPPTGGEGQGTHVANELLQRLQDTLRPDSGREAFTVNAPRLPAGFETLHHVARPPRQVLQKWEQRCRDAVDGTGRRGRNTDPFFPGDIELTREFLPNWAPPQQRKLAKTRAERERAQRVRLNEAAFDEPISIPQVEEEEQMGGFASFCSMLIRWGLGVTALRLAETEELSPSQRVRAATYPERPGCGTCRPALPDYHTDRPCRFFDVAQFFAYLDIICKISTLFTPSHAIDYDRKMRYLWSLRVSQGAQLDWEAECTEVRQHTMDDVLRYRPFLGSAAEKAESLKRGHPAPLQGAPPAKQGQPQPAPAAKPTVNPKATPAKQQAKEVCGFHLRGGCAFGDTCNFLHPGPPGVAAPKAGRGRGKGRGKGPR